MQELKLNCTNCKYKFVPKGSGKTPERCPYCNKPETLEKEKTAQDYLDEASSSNPHELKGTQN